jgi:hypothetical protein
MRMRHRDTRPLDTGKAGGSPRRVGVVGAALIAALALSGALPAPSARAGIYTVHACRAPDGTEAHVDWSLYSNQPGKISQDNCPDGVLFGFDARRSYPAGDRVVRAFDAADDTAIQGYSLWRSVWLPPNYRLDVTEHDADNELIRRVESCPGGAGCDQLGDPLDPTPLSRDHLVQRAARSGARRLRAQLWCTSCPASYPFPSATYVLHRADITVLDQYNPKLEEPPEGPLLDNEGDALIGGQQVWISASDRGSGVYQVLFEVDGAVAAAATIDDNNKRCRRPFAYAKPCKSEAEGAVTFDTTRIPDGSHRLRILVTDATGTNATAWGQTRIRTANNLCNPEPRVETRRVSARFAGRGRRIVTRYGARPRVKGKLTTPDGTPLANSEVCVAARNEAKGASLRQLNTVSTNDKGRFSLRLPRGPSRRVYLVSRTSSGSASASVRIRVRAPVKLRASSRSLHTGDRLTLSGKLGQPVPRRGVLVELQNHRPETGNWQTFGTTRGRRQGKGGKGKFHFGYTFSRTAGVQRYQFRARVPRESTYPYAPGASKPVTVTVAG